MPTPANVPRVGTRRGMARSSGAPGARLCRRSPRKPLKATTAAHIVPQGDAASVTGRGALGPACELGFRTKRRYHGLIGHVPCLIPLGPGAIREKVCNG